MEGFWRNVDRHGACWIWRGSCNSKGYGQYRGLGAHRISYEFYFGPIPDGLFICHHCDNPPCVNPNHLFEGTHADNIRDRNRKGRLPRFRQCTETMRDEMRKVRQKYGWMGAS